MSLVTKSIPLLLLLASCTTKHDTSNIIISKPEKKFTNSQKNEMDSNLKLFATKDAKNTILVMLPLSKDNETIGKSILNACVLAFEDYNNLANSDTEFVFIDTASATQNTINEKFSKKNLKAIIGPVFYNDIRKFASMFPLVPILSLSNNIKANNNHVVACGLSPNEEVKYIFNYAKHNNINEFVIALPKGTYGDTIIECVKDSLEIKDLEECENVYVIRYDSNDNFKDIESCIIDLKKDALFIIDPILDLSNINMKVFTLSSSALSAPSKWNGAFFASSNTNKEMHEKFIKKYNAKFESTPSMLDVIAYDLFTAIVKSNGNVFEKEFQGCFGNFYLQKHKGITRILEMFQITNNHVTCLTKESQKLQKN